jgi:hypothetical protein
MAPKNEDPLTKLAGMIDERIKAALEGQERKALEDKDPWARLEGIIDRRVKAALSSLSDEGADDDKGKGSGSGEEGERPKLGILGL